MEPFRPSKDKQNNFPVVRLSAPYHQLLCSIKTETGLPLGKIIEQCVDFALRNGGDWERQMLERVTGPLDIEMEPTEPHHETGQTNGQCCVQTLAKAFEALSDSKKEYLLGFAEGVIAARSPEDDQGQDKADKEIA